MSDADYECDTCETTGIILEGGKQVPCPTCRTTAYKYLNARRAVGFAHVCYDCQCLDPGYMVHKNVWHAAFPEYGHLRNVLKVPLDLCFACLAKRLGRELTPADFALDLPINRGILLGLAMSEQEKA